MDTKQDKYISSLKKNLDSFDIEKIKNLTSQLNIFDVFHIRIQSIEVWNFRNIEHGKVSFPNSTLEDIQEETPSMLGLYGQNGSGKTSIIMAISILKDLLSGKALTRKYESCIRMHSGKCSISYELGQYFLFDKVKSEEMSFLSSFSYGQKIYYSFDIIKTEFDNEDGSTMTQLHVVNEVLSTKVVNPFEEKIRSKQRLFDARPEESDNKGYPFGNKARFLSIVGSNTEVKNKLRNSKAIAFDRSTSFIFSKNTISTLNDCFTLLLKDVDSKTEYFLKVLSELFEILPVEIFAAFEDKTRDALLDDYFKDFTEEQIDEKFELLEKKTEELKVFSTAYRPVYDKILFFSTIKSLKTYGEDFLFVVDTTSTGLISVNEQWPILIWNLDATGIVNSYRVFLNMDKPSSVQEHKYEQMKASLLAVSKVLSAVVPEVSLEIVDLGKQIAKDGKTILCTFEVMSRRDNNIIPLRYESDGIRRLVSILSLLIAAYNQPFFTIAIDEIDAGVFEYLLGEILKVLSYSAKGQIIFTSHNLRALEVLPPKSLCFTTTNSKKKFVRLQNRGNSNFRDGYYRNIILGGAEDSIYNPTDQYEIELAFYEAGQN